MSEDAKSDDGRRLIPSQLLFESIRNAIYHTARRQYLDSFNRWLNFLVVLAGASAVGDIGENYGFEARYLAGMAALFGALQLVFDFGGRARTHEFLQRRYYELAADIEQESDPSQKKISDWNGKLHLLYADEPPPYRALEAISFNLAIDSLGKDSTKRLRIRFYHILFRNYWPFYSASFSYDVKSFSDSNS